MIRGILSSFICGLMLGCATASSTSLSGATGVDRTYRVSELTFEPKLLNGSEIGCALQSLRPLALRYAGASGTTMLDLTLDLRGRVEQAKVYRASGSPAVDAAVLKVAERMRFAPGRIGRSPVRCRFTVPVTIRLSETPLIPDSPRRTTSAACP